MKNGFMKVSATVLLAVFTVISCNSAQKSNSSNLPKDVAERPADEDSQQYDRAQLDLLKAAVESVIMKEKCTDAASWAISPLGSKACGGPVSYIAYPKKIEAAILPKIEEYRIKMADFNKKYNISSDCMMAAEPKGVKCEGEKAVLLY